MKTPLVDLAIDDQVAVVTFGNGTTNALSQGLLAELDRVMADAARKHEVGAVILTGAGRMFAAGADIKEIAAFSSREEGERFAAEGQAVFNRIEAMDKPVVAAMNGRFCLGGGLELALACHLRIAADRLRMGFPEITLGIMPGFGGTQRLPRLVGPARAAELILTGERITAVEALRIGLVNQVVREGEVLLRARSVARRMAGMGRPSVRSVLKALREGPAMALNRGLALESGLFGGLCETDDMREGLAAFLEKRSPRFRDA